MSNNKVDQIKAALGGMLSTGDAFYVGQTGESIVVRSISDKDSLKAAHPELHGVLLKYEQRMVGEGHEIWIYILTPVVLSGIVQANLLTGLGFDLSAFQSWWLYVGMLLAGFILNNKRLSRRVKKKFSQYKPEIINAIESSGISVDCVLSLIAKDNSLFNIRTQVMLDE